MFCGLYLKLKNDLLIMFLAQKVYLGNFVAVLKVTKSCQPAKSLSQIVAISRIRYQHIYS